MKLEGIFMHTLLAIDPGTTQSAYVLYDEADKKVVVKGLVPNYELLKILRDINSPSSILPNGVNRLVVEHVASYGMAVGATVFETCVWVGRFTEAFLEACHEGEPPRYRKLYRREEKIHLCGSMKAKDGNIRQALMDRYGSTRQTALGTKKDPGPLYGISKDIWAAMAVAITAAETTGEWQDK